MMNKEKNITGAPSTSEIEKNFTVGLFSFSFDLFFFFFDFRYVILIFKFSTSKKNAGRNNHYSISG